MKATPATQAKNTMNAFGRVAIRMTTTATTPASIPSSSKPNQAATLVATVQASSNASKSGLVFLFGNRHMATSVAKAIPRGSEEIVSPSIFSLR